MEPKNSFEATFKLLHLEGNSELDCTFNLAKAITIGRDHQQCDIHLDPSNSQFSRIHCKVYSLGRDVVVQDHSANGTYVNDKKLEKGNPKRVTSGDRISLAVPSSVTGMRHTWVFFSSCDGGIQEETGKVDWEFYHRHAKSFVGLSSSNAEHPQNSNPAYQAETASQKQQFSLVPVINQQNGAANQEIEDFRKWEIERSANPEQTAARHAAMGQNVRVAPQQASSSPSKIIVPVVVKPFHVNSRVLKHYYLGDVIGTGNFATVRKGFALNNPQKEVAIKIVEKRRFALVSKENELNFDRLNNEGLVMRTLAHKNIVQVYDVFDEPEAFTMVMEYCPRGDLFDMIVAKTQRNNPPTTTHNNNACFPLKPPFTEGEAKFLFIQLVEALLHMHMKGVVHRDLKPENILVQVADEVYYSSAIDPALSSDAKMMLLPVDKVTLKITDFGLAKFCQYGEKLTTFCGTAKYCAPEVAQLQLVNSVKQRINALRRQLQREEEGQNRSEFGDFFGNNNNNNNMNSGLLNTRQQIEIMEQNLEQLQSSSSSSSSSSNKNGNNSGYSQSVDIYSLGTILVVLLTGNLPDFINEPLPQQMQQNQNNNNNNNLGGQFFLNRPPVFKKVLKFAIDPRTGQPAAQISEDAKVLLRKMLMEDPGQRITLGGIISSPWLKGCEINGKDEFEARKNEARKQENQMFIKPTVQMGSEELLNEEANNNGNGEKMFMGLPVASDDDGTSKTEQERSFNKNVETLDNHLLASLENNNQQQQQQQPQLRSLDQMFGKTSVVNNSKPSNNNISNSVISPTSHQPVTHHNNNNFSLDKDEDEDSSGCIFMDGDDLDQSSFYSKKQELEYQDAKTKLGNTNAPVQFNQRTGTAIFMGNNNNSNNNNISSSINNNNATSSSMNNNREFSTLDEGDEVDFDVVDEENQNKNISPPASSLSSSASPPSVAKINEDVLRLQTMNSFQNVGGNSHNNNSSLSKRPIRLNNNNNNGSSPSPRNIGRNSPSRPNGAASSSKKKLLEDEAQQEDAAVSDDSATDVDDDDEDEKEAALQNKQQSQKKDIFADWDQDDREDQEIANRLGSPKKIHKANTKDDALISANAKNNNSETIQEKKLASFAIPNADDAKAVQQQKSPALKHVGNNNNKNNNNNGKVSPLSSLSPAANSTKNNRKIVWQWNTDSELDAGDCRGWRDYCKEDMEAIEAAFQKGKKRQINLPVEKDYFVVLQKSADLDYFYQYRASCATIQRRVRRGVKNEVANTFEIVNQ